MSTAAELIREQKYQDAQEVEQAYKDEAIRQEFLAIHSRMLNDPTEFIDLLDETEQHELLTELACDLIKGYQQTMEKDTYKNDFFDVVSDVVYELKERARKLAQEIAEENYESR